MVLFVQIVLTIEECLICFELESNQSISWMKENLMENVVSLKITIKKYGTKKK